MQTIRPFQRTSNTVVLAVTSTSASVAVPGAVGTGAIRIYNAGPNTAFVNFDGTTAVAPTAGSPTSAIPIMANTVEVFQIRNEFNTITAICAAAQTATLYLTLGDGA